MLQRPYVGDAAFGDLRLLLFFIYIQSLPPADDSLLGGKVEVNHFLYLFRSEVDVVHLLLFRHEVGMTEIIAFGQFVLVGCLCHCADIGHIRIDGVGHQAPFFPVTDKAVACLHRHVIQSEFAVGLLLIVADLPLDDA